MSEANPLSILIDRAIHVVLEDRPPDWDGLLERLDATIQSITTQISRDAESARQQAQQQAHQAQQVPAEAKKPERAGQTLESMLHAATAKLVKAKMEYEKETQQRGAPPQRRPGAGGRSPTASRKKDE